ncbi:MAG: 2Fe-2S iron-sulfur cluster binding domain-containing protein [Geminicoccaceae bacterium]|nr:2Fe-2S iron-sulfur cluster binding domain-containing protein [Geminicoccaceae bacterium]
MALTDDQKRGWHPVASSTDLAPRHVFHGRLWGQELACWRADDGHVNVWVNRCLHRGVRLTIGRNLGHELLCQYHGWRYANRSAGCTYIPAHPADAPARTVCSHVYPSLERHGLVWVALDGDAGNAVIADIPAGGTLLRQMSVAVAHDTVRRALEAGGAAGCSPFHFRDEARALTLFLQPVDAGVTVIRGILDAGADADIARLRALDHEFAMLRDRLEREHPDVPQPIAAEFRPVSEELAKVPERRRRGSTRRMRVERKWCVAPDVMAFRLVPIDGPLAAFQPGAHVDVHLPNGLVRQYSITNGPDDTTGLVIGVKRETDGRGGSAALHDTVQEGDVLALSEPRNNFPLRRDQLHTRLIAGGIGLTPLLSMARTLRLSGVSFELHVFARSREGLPFADELKALGGAVHVHTGLDAEASSAAFARILADQGEKEELYVCGPPAMLDTVRGTAAGAGWQDDQIHFEYFANERKLDRSGSFTVALARSAVTVEVPSGRSIVEVLREHDIDIPTSCEKGACGTCRVDVIEGEIDHQDVWLSDAEKAANRCMMACVSRGRGRIVLDL